MNNVRPVSATGPILMATAVCFLALGEVAQAPDRPVVASPNPAQTRLEYPPAQATQSRLEVRLNEIAMMSESEGPVPSQGVIAVARKWVDGLVSIGLINLNIFVAEDGGIDLQSRLPVGLFVLEIAPNGSVRDLCCATTKHVLRQENRAENVDEIKEWLRSVDSV